MEIPREEILTKEVGSDAGGGGTGSDDGATMEIEALRGDLDKAQQENADLLAEGNSFKTRWVMKRLDINLCGNYIVKVLLSMMCMYLGKTPKLKR